MSGPAPVGGEPAGTAPADTARLVGSGRDLARAALEQARADAAERARAARNGQSAAAGRRRAATRRAAPARASDGEPITLGAAVGRLLDERGWSAEVAVAGVLGRWREVVGPEIAEHCQPVALRDGELVVATDSTAWATQVRLLSATLLARVSAEVGAGVVTRLVVRGPAAPSWGHGAWRAAGGRGPRDTYG